MNYRIYFLAICFIASLSPVFAQKPGLSLKQAYEAAQERYPGISIKQAELKAIEHQAQQVKSRHLPQVNLQAQNTYGTMESSSGAFFPLPGTFNVNGNSINGRNTSLSTYGSAVVDWEIFSFGKLKKEQEAAGFKVKGAESELSSYELSLKGHVSKLYFSLLYHDVKLNWTTKNAKRIKEILEISTSLANAGLKPGADTALASSSYLQILSDQDLWRGRVEGSKYHLNEFTSLDIQDRSINSNPFLAVQQLHTNLKGSISAHPYLEKLNHEIKYQDALKQVSIRTMLPSLSLLGGLSTRGSNTESEIEINRWKDGFSNVKSNYLVGLAVTWNLTGIYHSKLEQKKIEQYKLASQSQFEQQEIQLSSGIQASQAQLSEQEKQVLKTRIAVEKAEEAYILYHIRYENGLIDLAELLQIQLLLQQAENKQIEAFKDLWNQVIIQAELTGDFAPLFETF